MTEVPSASYRKVVNAFERAGYVVIRQRGSHIRLRKAAGDKVLNLTVPAHTPVKKTTLAKIIKDAGLTVEEFKKLL